MNNEKSLIKAVLTIFLLFISMAICMFWAGKMHERMVIEQRVKINKDCVSETRYVIVGDTIRFKK